MEYTTKVSYKKITITLADKNAEGILSPKDCFKLLKEDFDPIQEKFILLTINGSGKLIEKHIVAMGSLSQLAIDTSVLFRRILNTNGNRFIVAHNHPSGDCTPSSEDKKITRRIKEGAEILGLTLLDHVIFTSNDHYSMRESGDM